MTETFVSTEAAFTATINPAEPIEKWLAKEWLLTNGTGSYSSGTLLGVNTRRYHGLLVSATRPPLGRVNVLAAVGETLTLGQDKYELSNWEFADTFHPRGFDYLSSVQVDSTVRMLYRIEQLTVEKIISLAEGRDVLEVRYRIQAGPDDWQLSLRPFVTLRDFHSLRHFFIDDQMVVESTGQGICVRDRLTDGPALGLEVAAAQFTSQANWWYKFLYRQEAQRGQDCHEDLFVPGAFVVRGSGNGQVVLVASVDRQDDQAPPAGQVLTSPAPATLGDDPTAARLDRACRAFPAQRPTADGRKSSTILAGFHWFGDWGRDTFIALPGLLLQTGRFAQAREVLETFVGALSQGMIPNCFNDYDGLPAYNSVDASLWFAHAADLYLQATADAHTWQMLLKPAVCEILDAYESGTRFGIHADRQGLIVCGDPETQLTWMDAKCNGQCFTPRPGAAVEVNALWYSVLSRMAQRLAEDDPDRARRYSDLARKVKRAFRTVFWNRQGGYLYDHVWDGQGNTDIRPNQIFAVSLPCSPLSYTRQRAVVDVVRRHLLTPFGLRSLDPGNPQYRSCYVGDRFSRDGAYHQGTVWSWLIGPFVEAYLRIHNFSPRARRQCRQMIQPLLDHLDDAGVGYVSEIFDGDLPHAPRGCIAQAWSVAELFRAYSLTCP